MQQGVVVCHGYRGIDKFVRVVVSPPSTPLSTPLGVDNNGIEAWSQDDT